MKMYVVMDGKRNGPHDPEAVKALYDSGKVSGDDLAWKAGMDDWNTLKELFPAWAQEPKEPLTPVSLSSDSESIDPSPVPEENDTKAASIEEEGASKAKEIEEQASEPDEVSSPSDSADGAVTTEDVIAEEATETADEETATTEDRPAAETAKPDDEPATPPPDKLYLGIDGERRGPLSPDETTALLLSSEVKEDNLAWKSGMKEWKPLKEVWPDCVKVTSDSETAEKPSDIGLLHKLQSAFRKK